MSRALLPLALLLLVPALHAETPANAERLAWWRDARFGMFIHWGPVTLKGTEIGWSRGAPIPIDEYDHLYQQFNPVKFDADAWVATAKAAGMKYIVLTTKHHDGFCLWDTKQTDYNVMGSPWHRDAVKELAEACRRQGLGFGTYYSVCDWHHPAFPLGSPGGTTHKPNPDLEAYTAYLKAQVKELVTGYGPLLTLWFDVAQGFDAQRGQAVVDYVRSLQPDILINNRCAVPADYDTPEQRVGSYHDQRPWETCMTIANQWAWKPKDPIRPLATCLQTLVRCAGGDGNLLFNVGPMPTGEIEPAQVARLKEMGDWLGRYGESVYGTRGGPWKPTLDGASTRRGNTVYLHVFRWQGPILALPPLPRKVVKATVLTGGEVIVREEPTRLVLDLPEAARQPIDTILKLELDSSAMDIPAIRIPHEVHATASNVYQQMDDYEPDMAFDQDRGTRWATDGGTHAAWIAYDFGKPTTFSKVRISEAYDRIRRFELQVEENGAWRTFHTGTTVGERFEATFAPVTGQKVRLNIVEATEGPTIWEIAFVPAAG